MRYAGFALRTFLRDLVSGNLNTLLGALILAISAISTTGILTDRLDRTYGEKAGEILGADLVIRGRTEVSTDWRKAARRLGLKEIEAIEFTTMLLTENATLLVGVRAVEPGYPLRGALTSSVGQGPDTGESPKVPQPGEAWAETSVLRRLNLSLGDSITVGEKELRVTRFLVQEPDRRGDISSLSPRMLINRYDLEATGLVQPNSLITHVELFSGEPRQLTALRTLIKSELRPDQKLYDLEEDRPELGKTLQRTRQFLSFLSLAILILASVAIALSAQDYVRRHLELVAILRAIGTKGSHIMAFLFSQLLGLGLLGSLLGILVGLLSERILTASLGDLLPSLTVLPRISPLLLSIGLGNVLLWVFSIPPIVDICKMPALGILQGRPMPSPQRRHLSYLASLSLLVGILYWHSGTLMAMASTLAMGAATLSILASGSALILWALRRITKPLPFGIKLGIRRLYRHPSRTIVQLMGFSLTFAALTLVTTLREDLIDDWVSHLPSNTPNYFVINLFDHDLPLFESTIQKVAPQQIDLYPVIRGRLTRINGEEAIKVARRDSQAEGSINRDLALTFTTRLPSDNRIVEGTWTTEESSKHVSIEMGLAKRLGVKLGDSLEFNILGEVLQVEVGSIRSVHWDRMTPNFFFIFPRALLEKHPRTWMTSLYFENQTLELDRVLVQSFPSISLIEVGRMVEQIRSITAQIGRSMLPLIALCLVSGLFVLMAGIQATRQDRDQEDQLFEIIGAERKQIRLTNATEFAALGLVSGFFGAVTAESARWVLYNTVLEIPFRLDLALMMGIPHASAALLLTIGLWVTRRKEQTIEAPYRGSSPQ